MTRSYFRPKGSDFVPTHKAKSSQKKYEEGWDRIFSKPRKNELKCPSCEEWAVYKTGNEYICMACGLDVDKVHYEGN